MRQGVTPAADSSSADQSADLAAQVRELRAAVAELSAKVAALEQVKVAAGASAPPQPGSEATSNPTALRTSASTTSSPDTSSNSVVATSSEGSTADTATVAAVPTHVVASPPLADADRAVLDQFLGTTLSATVDGYYIYNFNLPYDRNNQLRAYDLPSNSFSINQATLIFEHAPDPANGNRFGGRIDLQFGEATQTLGGSSLNELHPETWRNLFQAYGTYVAPIGSGLQLDFGKFASALGVEGNYTKDQINYSRSFFFDYLPFYHTGLRATYNLNPKMTVAYWAVNGAQQTEDFNGPKSEAVLLTYKPNNSFSWNFNYFVGNESRNLTASGVAIVPTPNGHEHVFDSYGTWNISKRLSFVGEADLVINRTYSHSAPEHVAGGVAYLRYQLPRQYALAGRVEYLADPNGLFSGAGQALKEATITLDRQLGNNFLARSEYRRDLSNQRYFNTAQPGFPTFAQPTATLGLIWWWGGKTGVW